MATGETPGEAGSSTANRPGCPPDDGESTVDIRAIGMGFGLSVVAVVVIMSSVVLRRLLIDLFPGPGAFGDLWQVMVLPEPLLLAFILGLVVGFATTDELGSGLGVAAGLAVGSAALAVVRFLAFVIEVPRTSGGDVLQFLLLDGAILPVLNGVVALIGVGVAWAIDR